MKKFIIALMVLGFICRIGFGISQAESTRTIAKKGKAISSSEQTAAHGITLYKVTGYATTDAAKYTLYDASTYSLVADSTAKLAGGEASAYDSLPTIDFGEEGMRFNSGLYSSISNCTIAIEYL